MISVRVNNRDLSIRFCYTKRYAVDVPDPTRKQRMVDHLSTVPAAERVAAKRAFLNREPRYMRAVRPLTQCYLEERQPDGTFLTLAKVELKLYYRDAPWPRKSVEAEKLRKWLIAKVLKQTDLDKSTRKCIWDAFLTRRVKAKAVTPPESNPPAAPQLGRPIGVIDVPPADIRIIPPDTVPEDRRIIAVTHRVAAQAPVGKVDAGTQGRDGHSVVNKVVPIKRPWHYAIIGSNLVH
jgi:hypothetical protein